MSHDSSQHDSHPTQSDFLSGPQIIPRRIKPGMTIAELIDQQFQAYNSARLNEAAHLLAEEMLAPEKDVTVGLTMADDTILQEEGVIRIYDILFEDKVLLDTDAFVRECLKSLPNRPISTSILHHHLGTHLLKAGIKPEYSMLAQATKWNVPIYTSSPGDSSIGMNVARHALDGNLLTLDPLADVNETTAIVQHATRNGVIILGGGSPKNFYLQTQPQLWEVLGIHKGGHDYFIQITADAPHWGGLSGATPSEAVSWGKIKPDQLKSTVVIYGDSTIALPLLTAYAVSKANPRPRRELFSKREELLKELEVAYKAGQES